MNTKFVFTGIVAALILVAIVFILRNHMPEAAVSGPKTIQQLDPRHKGPLDAPVILVEYSDFQCPACGKAQKVIQELMEKYKGKIHLRFRHFPLSGHQWSAVAHQAAECAGRQKQFWSFHDRLFSEQTQWSTSKNPSENFLLYARDLKLDLDSFAACLGDGEVTQEIMKNKDEGVKLKVKSTPTFFINNQRFVGHRALQEEGEPMIRMLLELQPLVKEASK